LAARSPGPGWRAGRPHLRPGDLRDRWLGGPAGHAGGRGVVPRCRTGSGGCLEQGPVSCRAGGSSSGSRPDLVERPTALARTMSGSRASLGRTSDQAPCRGAFGRWMRMRFNGAHLPAARVAGGAP
jgi:hypothetical protein